MIILDNSEAHLLVKFLGAGIAAIEASAGDGEYDARLYVEIDDAEALFEELSEYLTEELGDDYLAQEA